MGDSPPALSRCTLPGDPAPWFIISSTINKEFRFNQAAGRRVVLCFFGSLGSPEAAQGFSELIAVLPQLRRYGGYPFGVTLDPTDDTTGRVKAVEETVTVFFDYDRRVSLAFGVAQPNADSSPTSLFNACSVILDEGLRLVERIPMVRSRNHGNDILSCLAALPPVPPRKPISGTAPVLLIPNVIDRRFCQDLIRQWEEGGNEDSGYMRPARDGKLVGYIDYGRKRRRDHFLDADHPLYKRLSAVIQRRVIPLVKRAFHYDITRVERFCIARYDAEEGGYFKAHRDFEDARISHRAFAMTLNLNAEDYEGGQLIFAEFGQHLYKPGTGDAILFSGCLLHEALPVIQGQRFALLSFFYGEKEAQLRQGYWEQHGSDHATVRVTP